MLSDTLPGVEDDTDTFICTMVGARDSLTAFDNAFETRLHAQSRLLEALR